MDLISVRVLGKNNPALTRTCSLVFRICSYLNEEILTKMRKDKEGHLISEISVDVK